MFGDLHSAKLSSYVANTSSLVAGRDDDGSPEGQMKKILLQTALVVASLPVLADMAAAMPRARVARDAVVMTVDWRCGPGWRVTAWGDCRPHRRHTYEFDEAWPRDYGAYAGYAWHSDHHWRHEHESHDHDPWRHVHHHDWDE